MLIHPAPEDGESWPGYLLRVASLNYMKDGLAQLARLLDIHPVALTCSDPDLVMNTLGIHLKSEVVGNFALYGKGLNPLRKSGRTLLGRLCPQCLDEMPVKHLKASWDRALEFNCEHHQLLLVDRCHTCGAPISHMRRHYMQCNCGASFLGMRRQPTTFSYKSRYAFLDVADIYSTPAATFAASSPAEILALIFCKRLQSLDTLGSVPGNKRNAARFNDVFMSSTDMRSLDDVFGNWPTSLHSYLDRCLTSINGVPSDFLLSTPLIGVRVLPTAKRAITDWSFRRHRSRKPGIKSPALVQRSPEKTVGIKYVIQATGCSYDTAQHWINSGMLGQCKVTKQDNGSKRYFILKERVQKAIQISKSTTSVHEMARSIGSSNRAVRLMVKAQLVPSLPYGKATFNYRLFPAEAFALTNNLLVCARLCRVLRSDQMLLTSAIERFERRPVQHLQNFFSAVLSRKIKIKKTEVHVTRLDQLLIDCDDLRGWENRNCR